MPVKHFLTVACLGADNLLGLVDRTLRLAAKNGARKQPLKNKVVGIYFKCTSTRTRTAFTVGAIQLGASTVTYGPNDLQMVTSETVKDTGRVLSGFLDALVTRTNGPVEEMETFAAQDKMAVINAMSENEHPTQTIADLATLHEEFGRLSDLHVLYLGEGNNTAAAFALAVCQLPGMQLTLVTPEGYGLDSGLLEHTRGIARQNDACIEQHHDMN